TVSTSRSEPWHREKARERATSVGVHSNENAPKENGEGVQPERLHKRVEILRVWRHGQQHERRRAKDRDGRPKPACQAVAPSFVPQGDRDERANRQSIEPCWSPDVWRDGPLTTQTQSGTQ